MTRLPQRSPVIIVLALCAVVVAAVAAPRARAASYADVPKSHWAYAAITAVTERGPAGHKVLDDYGELFKPEQAITRELLARSLVLASGNYGEHVKAVAIADVAEEYRYFNAIQVALHHGYMTLDGEGAFRPQDPVPASQAEVAIIRWLKERYSSSNWSLLKSLRPSRWQPNEGWKTSAPGYLPYIVASRQLQLRYNHPSEADGHEVTPSQAIDRAEIAYMFARAYAVSGEWMLYGLADYTSISFPPLSERQREIARFALKFVGYPYIWAGEYPTKNSPYGTQKAGGFDCSGFAFYVMKMHFDYPITVNERGGSDMAARAKPRITRKQLQCGDLIFFAPNGPKSAVTSIYHVGLYLGDGWFIHSTGSTDGVTLSSLDSPTSTYYKTYFAWGRRLLKPSELPATAAQSAPAAVAQASPQPAAD
ncbi:MAG: NlpC/P60 family protein [Actinobacteria bacterium]|nr:NlpC/P60 family protein [Actinomycetota bacterium]